MSWGVAVHIEDPSTARELLEHAIGAHFDEAERAGTVMGQRAAQAREQGYEELADETQATADYTLGSAVAGREQAGAAIDAAVRLVEAEHISPVIVSLTGDANPDHAPDHELGLAARVSISLVRDA